MNRETMRLVCLGGILVSCSLLACTGAPQTPRQEGGETAQPAQSAPAREPEAPPAAEPPRPAPQQEPARVAPEPAKPRAAAPQQPAERRPVPPPAPVEAQPPAAAVAPPVPAAEPVQVAPPITKTVAAGTPIDVIFLDGLSSETSQAGDTFRVRVAQDVVRDGVVVIPAGSVVVGSVLEAVPLKKIGGTAKLGLEFTSLELTSGRTVPISASFAEQGKSETKKDAATIGGAAAGGAVLGRLLSKKDKGKGTVLGALVGAAAGTAIAAKSQGEQVEVPVGTEVTLQLSKPVEITVRP